MNLLLTNIIYRKTLLIALSGLTTIAIVLSILLSQYSEMEKSETDTEKNTSAEREVLYWVAPMDPNYKRDKPGLSPMGMELIPVYDNTDKPDSDLYISAAVEQNLGVRTASVIRGDFSKSISAAGYSTWDESSIMMLHTRVNGWLETFTVASAGDYIAKGQVIYEIFSPMLVSAQREYLVAIKSNNSALSRAAKDRLIALGFTTDQIIQLKKRGTISERLPYIASRDGVVVSLGARQGSYVKPETILLTLASLDNIWIDVDVHEAQTHWLKKGLSVTASLPSLPGQQLKGDITHIDPTIDPITRSVRLRLTFSNSEKAIKPNMFAKVTIHTEPRKNILSVPREAVIRSELGARVIVAEGQGKFSVRPVQTGIVSNNQMEILSGLDVDEQVVTSGQFLLDSEANGEQAMARLASQ